MGHLKRRDFDDLWPSSESGPTQNVQSLLPSYWMEPDRENILRWSNVPTDWQVSRWGIEIRYRGDQIVWNSRWCLYRKKPVIPPRPSLSRLVPPRIDHRRAETNRSRRHRVFASRIRFIHAAKPRQCRVLRVSKARYKIHSDPISRMNPELNKSNNSVAAQCLTCRATTSFDARDASVNLQLYIPFD